MRTAGSTLDGIDLERYSSFVLGSEREGLPDDVLAQCAVRATIPTSGVDSLNVAMAGTIALYARAARDTS